MTSAATSCGSLDDLLNGHRRAPTRTDQMTAIAPQFDTRDGQRFLMLKDETPDADRSASSEIIVVQHWLEELKRLVPTN